MENSANQLEEERNNEEKFCVFPRQLKELHDALAETAEKNLKSGFRKAGIVPLGVDQILRRPPTKTA